MYRNDFAEPTFTQHIPTVVEQAICNKHVGGTSGGPGAPCWTLELSNGEIARGVCNTRAKKAGMVGRISPQSLNLKRSPGGKRR